MIIDPGEIDFVGPKKLGLGLNLMAFRFSVDPVLGFFVSSLDFQAVVSDLDNRRLDKAPPSIDACADVDVQPLSVLKVGIADKNEVAATVKVELDTAKSLEVWVTVR